MAEVRAPHDARVNANAVPSRILTGLILDGDVG